VTGVPSRRRDQARSAKAHETTYGAGTDYVVGSPHLAHPQLHSWMLGRMRRLSAAASVRPGRCRILEVGAGHGTFTEHLADLGADVTVTEISKASADVLARRFRHSPTVHVMYDADGEAIFDLAGDFDIAFCVSVLHHIPDYLLFVSRLSQLVRVGGSLAAYQDPDWYPRRRRRDGLGDRAAYFAWRATQGDLRAGARTRLRRMRGRYDESLAADMTEYHVVRRGVDDFALADLLRSRFGEVELFRYWSTQRGVLQRLGEHLGLRNTFGVEATYRDDGGALPHPDAAPTLGIPK
jgi:SAM-dependent methyltransferase